MIRGCPLGILQNLDFMVKVKRLKNFKFLQDLINLSLQVFMVSKNYAMFFSIRLYNFIVQQTCELIDT